MRALVVEDDFISRWILYRHLQACARCDLACDGLEAAALFDDALAAGVPYDLVCLDIMMPGIDGHETLRRLRQAEARHGVAPDQRARVLMTTALEDHGNVRDAFANSADAYVIKPIEKQQFLDTLQQLGLPLEV